MVNDITVDYIRTLLNLVDHYINFIITLYSINILHRKF